MIPTATTGISLFNNGGAFSDKVLGLWAIEDLLNEEAPLTRPAAAPVHVSAIDSADATDVAPLGDALVEPAVIVPVSVRKMQRERLRNLQACLRALNLQDLERNRYQIIVTEQDTEPQLQPLAAERADHYLFLRTSRPFNRAWGMNAGVCAAAATARAVCLLDSEALPDHGFLSSVLRHMHDGTQAQRPYAQVTYMNEANTARAIEARLSDAAGTFGSQSYPGQSFPDSRGVSMVISMDLYREVHVFDERFVGFGYEDTQLWDRLTKRSNIARMPGTLLHMNHARTPEGAQADAQLYRSIRSGRTPAWEGPTGARPSIQTSSSLPRSSRRQPAKAPPHNTLSGCSAPKPNSAAARASNPCPAQAPHCSRRLSSGPCSPRCWLNWRLRAFWMQDAVTFTG